MTSPAAHTRPGSSLSGAVLALLLAGPVLAGCGDEQAGPAAGGLSAALSQSSDSENRHVLDVRLSNGSSRPVTVTGLQLRLARYDRSAPVAFDDEVRPGSATTFPVPYGAARCGQQAGGVLVVLLRGADGALERHVPVPPDEPLLARLHRQECRLERLREQVEIGLGPSWRRSGAQVEGSLVLTRRSGSDEVQLVAVAGSQVFRLTAKAPLPLVVPQAPGEQVTLPVTVTLPACAPHQIIESKRNAVFNATVAVGSEPLLLVQPTADAAGKAVLDRLIADVCAGRP